MIFFFGHIDIKFTPEQLFSLYRIQMSIFLELFKKNFLTIYIHILKGLNSLKIYSIDQIFFYRFRRFHWSCFVRESYHFLKFMRRKCQKTEFRGGHLELWTIDTPIFIIYNFFHNADRDNYLQILNQFWPNLVHTYKIHFWTRFVLYVVFKCY